MRRTRLAKMMMGIGTAAALLLPASGAFADRPRDRHVAVRQEDRRGGYDRHGRDDRRDGDRRRNDRRGDDRHHDRDRDRDRHRERRDSGGDNVLPWLIGGALLGAIIAGSR